MAGMAERSGKAVVSRRGAEHRFLASSGRWYAVVNVENRTPA